MSRLCNEPTGRVCHQVFRFYLRCCNRVFSLIVPILFFPSFFIDGVLYRDIKCLFTYSRHHATQCSLCNSLGGWLAVIALVLNIYSHFLLAAYGTFMLAQMPINFKLEFSGILQNIR